MTSKVVVPYGAARKRETKTRWGRGGRELKDMLHISISQLLVNTCLYNKEVETESSSISNIPCLKA